jgi:hypothetical protein
VARLEAGIVEGENLKTPYALNGSDRLSLIPLYVMAIEENKRNDIIKNLEIGMPLKNVADLVKLPLE